MSEEALQIAEERREAKGKSERERYSQVNAEFQRIARRNTMFLNEQYKEIEKNRMENTRGVFKKIGDIKGTFHVIKHRNCKDLTEAEEIKKRWQEYTEQLHRKGHDDLDNDDDVVTQLEPDILKCEVKWALGSVTMNKANRGNRIPVGLFKILLVYSIKH